MMDLFNKIPAAYRLAVLVGAGLVVLLVLWFYGASVSNRIFSWWFDRGVSKSQKEIQEYKDLAGDLLKQLQAEKEIGKQERLKRELAEKLLADKTLNSNEKLKLYEEAISKVPVPTAPQSVDELCARAKQLGLSCGE